MQHYSPFKARANTWTNLVNRRQEFINEYGGTCLICAVAAAYNSSGKSTNKVGGLSGQTVSVNDDYTEKYSTVADASIEKHETTLVTSAYDDNAESVTASIEKHETTLVQDEESANTDYVNNLFKNLQNKGYKVYSDAVVVPQDYTAVDIMSHNNLQLIVEPVTWFEPNNGGWKSGKIGLKITKEKKIDQQYKAAYDEYTYRSDGSVASTTHHDAVQGKGHATVTWSCDVSGVTLSGTTTYTDSFTKDSTITDTDLNNSKNRALTHTPTVQYTDDIGTKTFSNVYSTATTINGVSCDGYATCSNGTWQGDGWVYGSLRDCIKYITGKNKYMKNGRCRDSYVNDILKSFKCFQP